MIKIEMVLAEPKFLAIKIQDKMAYSYKCYGYRINLDSKNFLSQNLFFHHKMCIKSGGSSLFVSFQGANKSSNLLLNGSSTWIKIPQKFSVVKLFKPKLLSLYSSTNLNLSVFKDFVSVLI